MKKVLALTALLSSTIVLSGDNPGGPGANTLPRLVEVMPVINAAAAVVGGPVVDENNQQEKLTRLAQAAEQRNSRLPLTVKKGKGRKPAAHRLGGNSSHRQR